MSAKPTDDLQQFKIEIGSPDGKLLFSGQSREGYHRAYVCPSFLIAETVVEAVRGTKMREANARLQVKSLRTYLRRNGCVPAKGKFHILAKGREVEINHGHEASEYWTAIEVSTDGKRKAGMVFDASPYAKG